MADFNLDFFLDLWRAIAVACSFEYPEEMSSFILEEIISFEDPCLRGILSILQPSAEMTCTDGIRTYGVTDYGDLYI